MSPDVTGDLQALLRTMLGLYGSGQPGVAEVAGQSASRTADLHSMAGVGVKDYSGALDMRAAAAASQADRDGVVHTAVGSTGDGTVNGRGRLSNQIADFQSRVQAIASVGDARFTGPALLAAAQSTIGNATRQVNADMAAAQRQAAQIMPPPAANLMPKPRPAVSRRRSRSRSRPRLGSPQRPRRRTPLPSDGTAGGAAVSAASAWLGAKYVWGGGGAGGPTGGGFDCSGLTQYAIAQATNGEVILPRTTYDQIHSGDRVDRREEVLPGDLVFPASSWSEKGPEHVQLAAGGGMVIEAPTFGVPVRFTQMPADAVVVRVLGSADRS